MAKKPKTYSQVKATDELEQLSTQGTTAEEFVFEMLRIFAGYGDGQIRRTKDGPGNLAKDGKTILIKNLIAYRPVASASVDDYHLKEFYDEIQSMQSDIKITKHSPRLYMVSDGNIVIAYDPKENDWYENTIDLLWKDFEFFTPLAGIEKIQYTEETEADVKSAELMAKLFDDIRRNNDIRDKETVHALNIFMSRLLFCFFAEDTGLFPGDNLFTNTLKTHTKEDGSDLAEFIDRAFVAMSTNDPAILASLPKLYHVFPYVNGGLFKERYPIPTLSRRARTLILNCGEYNWRDINPDIFGSMIQAVVTPEQRAGLGMHYTSVPNIEKLIKPLFLDALEEEFNAACNEAKEKLAKKNVNNERAVVRLRNLLARLSKIKFFDPACGSGNFLIISYKRVRQLEIRIWKAIRDIANIAILPIPSISLTQFYGIEIDEYACDTATLSLWLAEHQMNVIFHDELGVQPETLPLKPSGHIVCCNACRLNWNIVCPHDKDDEVYIMGNPPYLGSSMQDASQKADLESVCGHFQNYKNLDYIASWFYKAALYITDSKSAAAFVTTDSLCQGESVPMLWPNIFKEKIKIQFAYRSFKWSNNAKHNAGVIVTIIGLASIINKAKNFIYDDSKMISSEHINAYLISGPDINISRRTRPISCLPKMVFGNKATDGGFLILDNWEKEKLLNDYPNANKFIKYYEGSDSFINGETRYCLWITDQNIQEALQIEPIKKRFDLVRSFRLASKAPCTVKYADKPYLFKQRPHKDGTALLVPRVSSERRKYIPIGFVGSDTIASDATQVIYGASTLTFALLANRMHTLWLQAVGGRLGTSFRYSNLVYNSFPIPQITTSKGKELKELAQIILDIRNENFDMTLAEMYNPERMPENLAKVHRQLDFTIERIYRLEPFTSDEERLEYLFNLYNKMSSK